MKKLFLLVFPALIFIWGCSKSASSSSAGSSSSTSIWPLKAGNTWIYQDSIFNTDGTIGEVYSDSTYINSQITSRSGVTFYGITDSLGWFGTGSLLAVDPTNTTIYGLDSINSLNSPYLIFALTASDGYLIGTSQDFSNPSCIGLDALYGFASTYSVASYTCYKNIEYIKDCNGNITYTTVSYYSPGVGLVRVEEYSPVPGSTTNALYLDYSQTLKSVKLK